MKILLVLVLFSFSLGIRAQENGAKELYDLSEIFLANKNFPRWWKSVRQAADMGSLAGLTRMGDGYMQGLPVIGVEKNLETAIGYYTRAADMGYKDAIYMLGNAHREKGTYNQALAYYRKLSDGGNHDATQLLGEAYLTGEGIEANHAKALELFTKGMNAGHSTCTYDIGYMYRNGSGVARDVTKAMEFYQKAGEQGNGLAYRNLGEMYSAGEGVEINAEEAFSWFALGSEAGDAQSAVNCLTLISDEKVLGNKETILKYAYRSKELGHPSADELVTWAEGLE